jgi:tetratricopeptide (TPR) repeat protein
MDSLPTSPERAEAFLQSTWGLVHYLLVEDSDRIERTREWVAELQTDESASDRFLSFFDTSSQELDQALQSYISREDLPQRRVTVDVSLADGSYAALSRHDNLLAQADLLLHTQPTKTAQVESLLADACELEPSSPIARAGEGLLKQQAGEVAAARDLYQGALADLSQTDWSRHRDGFRLHFYYGEAELELIGQKRPDTPEVEERLSKAIESFQTCTELRPMFGEAWARLGYAHSLSATSTAEAVPALQRAYELLPPPSWYVIATSTGPPRFCKKSWKAAATHRWWTPRRRCWVASVADLL